MKKTSTFDIDLAQAVCDKLGYKMEVKNLASTPSSRP